MSPRLLFSFSLLAILLATAARAFETNVLVRDPSTIIKHDGVYWVYGTGKGVQQFSSTDMKNWTYRGAVFPDPPAWVAQLVPGNKENVAWAPDIHSWNGKFYLYYSYSTWGKNESGIGVATSDTLNPNSWVDLGPVVHSGADSNFNTIDPCIFQDANGQPWLSFGSYFSGIKLIQIDPRTGKQSPGSATIYNIATRHTPGNAIEASCVYYHDGYYYLFVAWDACCAGSKSTYNIRVGRSKTVTGPYLDKDGKDMMDGGGTLFLGSMPDNGQGRPFDDEVGPGHAGILQDGNNDWFSYHEEWARDKHGATTMNVNALAWDTDGWPRLILDPGPYKIVDNLPTHDVVSVVGNAANDHAPLELGPYEGLDSQKWTLHYEGDGYYSITGVGSKKALSLVDCSDKPGAKTEIAPFKNQDCQEWYLHQNDDGAYFLYPKNGKKANALDIPDCSMYDAVRLQQWLANGLNCQEFSFRRW